MVKLGSLDSKDSWPWVRWVLGKLMTHLLVLLEACDWVLLPNDCVLVPLLFLLANILNLSTYLSLSLINLDYLTLFMTSLHLHIVVVVTIDNSP